MSALGSTAKPRFLVSSKKPTVEGVIVLTHEIVDKLNTEGHEKRTAFTHSYDYFSFNLPLCAKPKSAKLSFTYNNIHGLNSWKKESLF